MEIEKAKVEKEIRTKELKVKEKEISLSRPDPKEKAEVKPKVVFS